jgi:hypothetical protein
MFSRLFPLAAFAVLCSFGQAKSESCWRDTVCDGPLTSAFPGPWEKYIFAPSSRLVEPKHVFTLANTTATPYTSEITLAANGSPLVLDFGIEVGGIVHLDWVANSTGGIGLAFTEGKNWIGKASDNSHSGSSDGAIYANITSGAGTYVMPDMVLRGGFRYLSLFLVGAGPVKISNLQLEISFQPTWSNLRAYQGYFYSNDDMLNKIWYSGAYTLQTSTVAV